MTVDERWAATREMVKTRLQLSAGWEESCPGTLVFRATIPSLAYPVGQVWITQPDDQTIVIQNSFVIEWVRRCGIRTRIHEWMTTAYPKVQRIITGGSTREGQAWMRKNGFKKAGRDWEWKR